MMYRNLAEKCASHLLFILKTVKAQFRITVNLRVGNLFRIGHHLFISLPAHEMTKQKGLKLFSEFNLFHGYWKMLLYPDPQQY